jgi:hypothetical protein
MCRGGWFVAFLWATAALTLSGQRLERVPGARDRLAERRRLEELGAHADSLLREWRRANAIAALVDTVDRVRAGGAADTIGAGSLRIVANPSPLPLREAAARAWAVLDSTYGPEARQLEQRPITLRALDPDTSVELPRLRGVVIVPWDLHATDLALVLLTHVQPPEADAAFKTWLGGLARPLVRPERHRAHVYVELVTVPSQAGRSCFLGEIESCRHYLDLVDSPDIFLRWYPSPDERRAVVSRSLPSLRRGGRGRAFELCEAGSDSACVELLRSMPRGELPQPAIRGARETLVHLALRLGGREAFHRLLASPDAPIADRLAGAAGVPIDSLVARWRAEILGSRPVPVTLPPWGPWIAIAWMAVFAACGLRSSRWRVS